MMAQAGQALAQRVPAAVLAQHQLRLGKAHVFGTHDFVGAAMLQHAVLVDAGFMRESILADHGLVARQAHSQQVGQQARARVQALGDDAGVHAEQFRARLEGHHDFLQRGIAGPLADAGEGALDLPCARCHRGQAVGHRHAQVVVAMHADDGAVDIAHVLAQVGDALAHFGWRRVANGIGHVEGAGAGVDHRGHHLGQVLGFRTHRVFGGKFHVVAQLAGAADAGDGVVDDLLLAHGQLVFAMQRTGGDEDVDARLLRGFQRPGGRFDVAELAARQRADGRAAQVAGNGVHRSEVFVGSLCKARFDDVHAKVGKRLGQPALLRTAHRIAGRLFTVAQRGIEDPHALAGGFGSFRVWILCLHGSLWRAGQQKTPHPFPGAGFQVLSSVSVFDERPQPAPPGIIRTSTSTSATRADSGAKPIANTGRARAFLMACLA